MTVGSARWRDRYSKIHETFLFFKHAFFAYPADEEWNKSIVFENIACPPRTMPGRQANE
jgi:hypothetical protein